MPKAWSIDGIESTVADTIDDYEVFPVSADMQRLQIRLRSSLSSGRPLRLKIRTHRAQSFLLEAEHFRPIQFRDVRRVAQVVAVAPDSSYRLDVTGDAGVTLLSPDDLRRASDDRVQPRPGGMIFADDPGADSLAIAITQEAPSFSARILVEADGKNELLEETYRIECVPESTPISRLFIHLSEPRDAQVVWQLVDQPDGILQPEPPDEQEKEAAREIWEIVLRSPQSEPFVLQGTRSTPFHEKLSVSLATLPAAAVQDGWLKILSSDGSQLTIDAQSVKAIPRVLSAEPIHHFTSPLSL